MGYCVVYCSPRDSAWKSCISYEFVDKVYGHGDSGFHAYLDGVHAGVCNGCSNVGLFNRVSGYSAKAYYVARVLGHDRYSSSAMSEQRLCLEIVGYPPVA